jgi:hypothetical protein
MTRKDRDEMDLRRPPLEDGGVDYERALLGLGDGGSRWVLAELNFAWRGAHRDAVLAYTHWCAKRDRTSYLVYRAAQDRADAAQDALCAHHAGEPVVEALAG